jgi:hypothetical protein
MAAIPHEQAHLERTSVLVMLFYCVLLAGLFYALSYTPGA